jgi:hypothetical protein
MALIGRPIVFGAPSGMASITRGFDAWVGIFRAADAVEAGGRLARGRRMRSA